MTTRNTLQTTPRATAFVLSLTMTLAIFSGVLSLAAAPQPGALLAQSQAGQTNPGAAAERG